MYDIHHSSLVATMNGHQSWVLSTSISPTGKEFATGYNLKTMANEFTLFS
jgi:hypothetical protein